MVPGTDKCSGSGFSPTAAQSRHGSVSEFGFVHRVGRRANVSEIFNLYLFTHPHTTNSIPHLDRRIDLSGYPVL